MAIDTLVRCAARVLAFFRRSRHDDDLEQELESHRAMLVEEHLRQGMTIGQARRAAAIRLGSAASLKEQHRGVRGLAVVETFLLDLRFALRLISRDRWFSAAAIAALALGIGANTVGFTIVNGAFFRGLPFDEADRLYVVSWSHRSGRRMRMSHVELQDWRARSRTFESLAAYSDGTMNISDDRALPEQIQGTWISANLFRVLRQPPLLGRDLTPADEAPGAEPVVVIGYGVWKNRFDADPGVVGRIMRVNGQPAAIVGVMPEGMKFPDNTEAWAPFVPTEPQRARDARVLGMFGRLAAGVDRREALAELSGIGQQFVAAYPELTKDLVGVRVETFPERFIGGAGRPMIMTVMAAVVVVLLIACANVANMLLSRSAYRAREIAVRTALGATRWRIARQLLIESVVLGLLGGGVGLMLAVAGVGLFDAAMRQSLPYWVVFRIDYVVFAYAAAICVVTGVLFGFAPALHVSKMNNHFLLKEGGRGATGGRRVRRFSGAMVVAELALTMVLLVAAGSLIRSFMALYAVDLGIEIEHLMAMRVQLPETVYPTAEARRAFFERLEPRLAAIPGVEAAALTTGVPPLDGGERLLLIEGAAPDARPVFVGTVTISPRFFAAVGVPLLHGRNFQDPDGAPGHEAVIVNERLAGQFFLGEDPIGRRIRFTQRQPPRGQPPDVWRTIVGISPSIKQGSPLDGYVNAVAYIPYRQESPAAASLLVRSTLPPGSVMEAVRREVQAIDRDQPVFTIQTVEEILAADRWWQRTWSGMFGTLAVIGLLLSAVGLYAVMAYSVAQRTQEIGVRMALGARKQDVTWMVLRRGLLQLAIGLTLGFAGSLAVRRLLPGGMVGIGSHDPAAIVTIAAILTLVSLAACLVPARRATRVDPLVALRAE